MSQCISKFRRVGIGSGNIEERDEDDGKTDPEGTIRSKREGAESVSSREFPHSSAELSQTAICEGKTDDDIWCSHASSVDIGQTEDKGGERETAETERAGIGELTEQAFMGFRVKVLSGRREDGRLVSLSVSTGISGFAAVIVDVVVGLEIAGAVILITGKGRHCGSEIETRRLYLKNWKKIKSFGMCFI